MNLSGIGSTKKKKNTKNNSHDLRKPKCVYSKLGGEIRQWEPPLPSSHLNVIFDVFLVTIKLFPLAHSRLGSSRLTVYILKIPTIVNLKCVSFLFIEYPTFPK